MSVWLEALRVGRPLSSKHPLSFNWQDRIDVKALTHALEKETSKSPFETNTVWKINCHLMSHFR
jgi:hypothetical protein